MTQYIGTILRINLSRGKIVKEVLGSEYFKDYVGGRGVNAKILYDELPEKADPLGEDNILLFGIGPLTGTSAPTSGRFTVTCKSPLTNLYMKSTCGGHWGAEVKFAGYDVLAFYGRSKKPVYLWIDDENYQLKDAAHLWGKDVRETDTIIKRDHGDINIKTVVIGPAGENLVKFASPISCIYRTPARAGSGAVMGSKKIKAIAVRGTGEALIMDKINFWKSANKSFEKCTVDYDYWWTFHSYGTEGTIALTNELGLLPVKNFQTSYTPHAELIDGHYINEHEFLEDVEGCFNCPMACSRFTKLKKGVLAQAKSEGPEYETLASLGSNCENYDVASIIKMNELCNIYGLDTISTGSTIAFVMECYEKGIINESDTDGLSLRWGDSMVMIKLIKNIVFRKGFGDLLAEGTREASKRIGKGSSRYAVQVKGLEQSMVDTRLTMAYALAFAVNPRGPDHLHAMPLCELRGMEDFIKKITGTREAAKPLGVEGKSKLVKWNEEIICISDMVGLCTFITSRGPIGQEYSVTPKDIAEMFSAATGIKIRQSELMKCGERVLNLERLINLREGLTRKDDTLHERFFKDSVKTGPNKGIKLKKEVLDKMIEEYYDLHGWDKKTGIPKTETLRQLGIKKAS